MMKVKDCFCGCTLRTGTVVLILLVLFITGTSIPRNISFCLSHGDQIDSTSDDEFCSYFEIVNCIIGFITSVIAIIGIIKGSPNCMIPFLLYMGYFVVICGLLVILVIISPDWFIKIVPVVSMDLSDYVHPKYEEKKDSVVRLRAIFACLATGVIYLYFFIIIKSYRTSLLPMPNHDNRNKQKGSDPSAVTVKLDRS